MSNVWLTIPSKRPPEEAEKVLKLWRQQGYKIALWRDDDAYGKEWSEGCGLDLLVVEKYPGYARAVNELIWMASLGDEPGEWFIAAGDDVEPDMNHTADEIADSCSRKFGGTFGVMQPVADRWGDRDGAYIDRVAGSAWIGREFARRAYGGNGPLWPEYFHMGVDEELQAVATRLGVFWQRPDLIHLHRHWGRGPNDSIGNTSNRPAFLDRANSGAEWQKYKRIYAERAAANFPGSGL